MRSVWTSSTGWLMPIMDMLLRPPWNPLYHCCCTAGGMTQLIGVSLRMSAMTCTLPTSLAK